MRKISSYVGCAELPTAEATLARRNFSLGSFCRSVPISVGGGVYSQRYALTKRLRAASKREHLLGG